MGRADSALVVAGIALALIAAPWVAAGSQPDETEPGNERADRFVAPLDGNQWFSTTVMTAGDLNIGFIFTNLTNSWVTEGILVYDAEMNLVASVFGMSESGDAEVIINFTASAGPVHRSIGFGDEPDKPDWPSGVKFVVTIPNPPEQVRLIVWSAGPAAQGFVYVEGAAEIQDWTQGESAYAVQVADFSHIAYAGLIADDTKVQSTPHGIFRLPVQNHLVGIAWGPVGGLVMRTESDTALCTCDTKPRESWVTGDVEFRLSGAAGDFPLVLMADVAVDW